MALRHNLSATSVSFLEKERTVGIIDDYAGRIELDFKARSYADKIRKILADEKIYSVKVWVRKW